MRTGTADFLPRTSLPSLADLAHELGEPHGHEQEHEPATL